MHEFPVPILSADSGRLDAERCREGQSWLTPACQHRSGTPSGVLHLPAVLAQPWVGYGAVLWDGGWKARWVWWCFFSAVLPACPARAQLLCWLRAPRWAGGAQEGGLCVPRGALGHLSSVGLWRRMGRGLPGCPVLMQLRAPPTTQELTGTAPWQILQEDRHRAKADKHL